ncbi:hypothetical protein [Xenorhabdus bovienii]|uniref:Uncharacterized protein n=1 Tax=Xenorhabdus bovienii str. feltiae Moldova TaxID=1398200 RepID=A0A077NTV2_XENBV|nr:hypothetical protein [Xenorhabdus bovienii]CDH01838.1 conserved hypothetical protein [Xenorhabdus bovienii str. feltiae Moldova]
MEVKEKIATVFPIISLDNNGENITAETELIKPSLAKALSKFPNYPSIYLSLSFTGLKRDEKYSTNIDIVFDGESCLEHVGNPYGGEGQEFIAKESEFFTNTISSSFIAHFPVVYTPEEGVYEIKVTLRNSNGEKIDQNSYYFNVVKTPPHLVSSGGENV